MILPRRSGGVRSGRDSGPLRHGSARASPAASALFRRGPLSPCSHPLLDAQATRRRREGLPDAHAASSSIAQLLRKRFAGNTASLRGDERQSPSRQLAAVGTEPAPQPIPVSACSPRSAAWLLRRGRRPVQRQPRVHSGPGVPARLHARSVRAAGWDYGIRWRVHVALWAATSGTRIPGDFVECGVGRGMFSRPSWSTSPTWDQLGKRFWLIDTFLPYWTDSSGEQTSAAGVSEYYATGPEAVAANFAEWNNVEIVPGRIPEILAGLEVDAVAYLHIDLNAAPQPSVTRSPTSGRLCQRGRSYCSTTTASRDIACRRPRSMSSQWMLTCPYCRCPLGRG